MKKTELYVPEQIRYISKWKELFDYLPKYGKYIVNKALPDSGATTAFIGLNRPVILASPRKTMLNSKARQIPEAFYFKAGTPPNDFRTYMCSCRLCGKQPKILVTWDSLEKVIRALDLTELQTFLVVIDEVQCLIGDAAFKGDSILRVVQQLDNIPNIVYLSATVHEDSYLDNMEMFAGLPYYQLVWSPKVKRDIQTIEIETKSLRKEAIKIIERYKTCGYFESNIVDGQICYAREGAFYLNDIRDIIAIIKACKLKPDEVNIICSELSESKLKKIGHKRGEAPLRGESHKPITMTTKASFEGTDYYMESAYTYIFCNPNKKNLALDLYIDIPQIMGRLRVEDNPFKYAATIFYQTSLKKTSKEEFEEEIRLKEDNTKTLLRIFEATDIRDRKPLIDQYISAHENDGFEKNYLTVIESNGVQELHVNNMVKVAETRAWDIKNRQYNSTFAVLSKLEEAGIHCEDLVSLPNDIMTQFATDFRSSNNFERSMKCYCEFRSQHPEYGAKIEATVSIPVIYHQYYWQLGYDTIKAQGYKQKNLDNCLSYINRGADIGRLIRQTFQVGNRYLTKDIKASLQKIYDDLGIKKCAKGSDLKDYFQIKPIKDAHGNNGFELHP